MYMPLWNHHVVHHHAWKPVIFFLLMKLQKKKNYANETCATSNLHLLCNFLLPNTRWFEISNLVLIRMLIRMLLCSFYPLCRSVPLAMLRFSRVTWILNDKLACRCIFKLNCLSTAHYNVLPFRRTSQLFLMSSRYNNLWNSYICATCLFVGQMNIKSTRCPEVEQYSWRFFQFWPTPFVCMGIQTCLSSMLFACWSGSREMSCQF
jgi:hypothetical protein